MVGKNYRSLGGNVAGRDTRDDSRFKYLGDEGYGMLRQMDGEICRLVLSLFVPLVVRAPR